MTSITIVYFYLYISNSFIISPRPRKNKFLKNVISTFNRIIYFDDDDDDVESTSKGEMVQLNKQPGGRKGGANR